GGYATATPASRRSPRKIRHGPTSAGARIERRIRACFPRQQHPEASERGTTGTTIQEKTPDALAREIDRVVRVGWFPCQEHVIEQARRRFLESPQPERMEKHLREDVE